MKTLLLPVDFSNTCLNTLKYVGCLSKDLQISRIILLKSYYVSMYAQLLPSVDFVQLSADDILAERQRQEEQLQTLSIQMLSECNPAVKIELASSEEPLLRAIQEVVARYQPDLLVLGAKDEKANDDNPVGDRVVTVAKTSTVPVLVVPPQAKYQPLKQVLVPCDFNAVARLSLLSKLQSLNFSSHPELIILSVNSSGSSDAAKAEHTELLRQQLQNNSYRVEYVSQPNVVEGVVRFADEYDVQLIVALPGKHSFFYNLTHQSISQAIATNAHQPVLILK